MAATYESDIVAWADEQAALIRAGRFDKVDIEHVADEVEDVGRSEERELASRMAVLLAHLLKWRYQPERRGTSWQVTIRAQRQAIARRLLRTPSLKAEFNDPEWLEIVWGDAVGKAAEETGLKDFPLVCPWSREQVMDLEFMPA
jgi:Domain of unknown function DUF29